MGVAAPSDRRRVACASAGRGSGVARPHPSTTPPGTSCAERGRRGPRIACRIVDGLRRLHPDLLGARAELGADRDRDLRRGSRPRRRRPDRQSGHGARGTHRLQPDADVERAANAAAYYGLNNAGQVCISVERVYVEAPIYDEFVGRLVENVKALRQGPPTAPGESEVGAITSPPQVEIIDAHVRDARDKGASVLTGGRARDGDGRFYEPTVIVGVDHTMACMRDETFGPTIPVMRVADTEEAIRLANDSRYGLQASVFSRDRSKAANAPDARITLPNERAGLAFVFRVFDRISYALVMQLTRPVSPLDVVQTP